MKKRPRTMPPEKEMTFLEHLEELKTRLIRVFISVGVVAVFAFTFGLKQVSFGEQTLILPVPDPFENLSAQVIAKIRHDLLPSYVQLIVTEPAQAIIAQFLISIFLGILLSMPIIVRELTGFVNPGLYPSERRMATKIIAPASLLFLGGVVFSYVFVAPFTLDFLYRYTFPLDATAFITIDSLVGFVALFVGAMGLAFQLPLIMYVITKAGVVEPRFWRDNFTYAVIGSAVFGAVITPDGSGITMWFIALPMILLYVAGYLAVRRTEREPRQGGAPAA